MRRTVLINVLCFAAGLALGALMLFLVLTRGWLPDPRETADAGTDQPVGNEVLLARAMEVAGYLRERNWSALAGAVHPELGVRFTPYSSVSEEDLVFTAAETAGFGGDSRSYMWGYSDGPGEPMYMTVREYFERFIFDADYTQAPRLCVNGVQVYGNAVENVAEAYPEGSFVEFYYDGLDPVNEGMDWCALKLVFQPWEGRLMLVGVIHSEWTI